MLERECAYHPRLTSRAELSTRQTGSVIAIISQAAAEDTAPAWITYASLVLSIIALAVAMLSLGWAIYSWQRGGEVVSVSGDLRAPLFQSGSRRPVRAGEAHSVLTITAYNRGRSPVRVHGLHLADHDLKRRSQVQLEAHSDNLPAAIAARDRARWYVHPRTLGVLTKQRGTP
jgi:hypothetical protein